MGLAPPYPFSSAPAGKHVPSVLTARNHTEHVAVPSSRSYSLQGHACLSGLSSPALSWLQKRSWQTATLLATPVSSPVCQEPHFISKGQALVDCESKPRGTRNKRSPGFPGERHESRTFLIDSRHTTSTPTRCVLSAVVVGVRERLGKGDA